MEKKVIDRFYHEHPLILTENVSEKEIPNCYGCGIPVTNLELAYVCSVQNCLNRIILHKKCGELPNQIFHPKHPQHPIPLFDYRQELGCWCDICLRDIGRVLGYRCSSCNFDADITCPNISVNAIIEDTREIQHPSHPHPLTLMRKSPFPFYCDGCGVQEVDMAYICSICEFWVHKSCASLPLILPKNHHHHHDLSLAFTFPAKHKSYIFYCDVCDKRLGKTRWVYFCGDCRFFAHLRCVAFTTAETTKQEYSNLEEDDTNLIEFPLYANDISKELITPFVMREKDLNMIPNVTDMPTTVNMPQTTASFSLLLNYHKHHLSLVAEPHDDNKITHEEDEDEATNDELKICDVCVTPISSPPYYQCASCKYFIHSICYLLPKTFSSSSSPNLYGECPETHDKNHRFTLYTSSEFTDMDSWLCECELCGLITNGMFYECEGCEMKIDVKCASLPTSIRHASHPHHKPLILSRILDCEGEMHPKRWMYHCRQCDLSFHLDCLKTASGWFRNIKFGRRFLLDGIHPNHPLTFNCITIKRRCDICHYDRYNFYGLECASCYYLVCIICARRELDKKA